MTEKPESYLIDEAYAAQVFLAARGRGGDTEAKDRACLAELLKGFADGGVLNGLELAKTLFRQSIDSTGRCKRLPVQLVSDGDHCQCFLCLVDREMEKI